LSRFAEPFQNLSNHFKIVGWFSQGSFWSGRTLLVDGTHRGHRTRTEKTGGQQPDELLALHYIMLQLGRSGMRGGQGQQAFCLRDKSV